MRPRAGLFTADPFSTRARPRQARARTMRPPRLDPFAARRPFAMRRSPSQAGARSRHDGLRDDREQRGGRDEDRKRQARLPCERDARQARKSRV